MLHTHGRKPSGTSVFRKYPSVWGATHWVTLTSQDFPSNKNRQEAIEKLHAFFGKPLPNPFSNGPWTQFSSAGGKNRVGLGLLRRLPPVNNWLLLPFFVFVFVLKKLYMKSLLFFVLAHVCWVCVDVTIETPWGQGLWPWIHVCRIYWASFVCQALCWYDWTVMKKGHSSCLLGIHNVYLKLQLLRLCMCG